MEHRFTAPLVEGPPLLSEQGAGDTGEVLHPERQTGFEKDRLGLQVIGNAAWNDTRWKHERFNQLLAEAREE